MGRRWAGPGQGAEPGRWGRASEAGRRGGSGWECVGGRVLLGGTTGQSTALAFPASTLPRGSARSFACGRGYEAVSHGMP
jgi:hypothetical protein